MSPEKAGKGWMKGKMSRSNDDIAIVGMACIFPGAPDLQRYWQNILSSKDAVSDPPASLGFDEFYDPGSNSNDRIYCKKGGFIQEFAEFDPIEFGIMPDSVDGSSPEHFLALRVARDALSDAGYIDRPFDRERTGVIVGHELIFDRGQVNMVQHSIIMAQTLEMIRRLLPDTTEADLAQLKKEMKAGLPPFDADTCPGLISSVITGRIANRLDLRGPSFTVDGACASSLVAFDVAAQELRNRRCDMVITGGVQAGIPLQAFLVFCLVGALSRRGRIRPFDENADGTLIGEGVGMLVLKRRDDAERDGDRIYALARGAGVSSDGRGAGFLMPRLEGEVLALERAYGSSGVSPRTVGLIEAHGTGTPVGDPTEIEALNRVFGPRQGNLPHCALGTVKSMISHTIAAAGSAGLIKAALSLHGKVLPPTLCDRPRSDRELASSRFYVNTALRPWIHGEPHPRRAGVSAFGFGGINSHVVLEESSAGEGSRAALPAESLHDTELVLIEGDSRQDLVRAGEKILHFIGAHPDVSLADVAYTCNCPTGRAGSRRLAVVAGSVHTLGEKIRSAIGRMADPACREIKNRGGIFFFEESFFKEGSVAFLFPGEGSQYSGMLSDLCILFPEVRERFDGADSVFRRNGMAPLPSQVIFPAPFPTDGERTTCERLLWARNYAVSTVVAADLGMMDLLRRLGIAAHAVVGHSRGDDAVLSAAGILDSREMEAFLALDPSIEADTGPAGRDDRGTKLMAVGAVPSPVIDQLVSENDGKILVAMDNCPNQVVLCGSAGEIDAAREVLVKKGGICYFLPFHRAYHTPWFKPFSEPHARTIVEGLDVRSPGIKAYSCAAASSYPDDPEEIRRILISQWSRPVRFRETISGMYDDGVKIFVEVGPSSNLAGFVDDTLGEMPHIAVSSNVPSRSGLTQLNIMLGMLAAHGVPMNLEYLYSGRKTKRLDFDSLERGGDRPPGGEAAGGAAAGSGNIKLNMALPRLVLPPGRCGSSLRGGPGGDQATGRDTGARVRRDRIMADRPERGTPRERVVEEYMQTMEEFFGSQEEIIGHFQEKEKSPPAAGSPGAKEVAGEEQDQ